MSQDSELRRSSDDPGDFRWEVEAARQRATVSAGLDRAPGLGVAAPVSGERRLVAAILGDALNEVLRSPEIVNRQDLRKAERSRDEARRWIDSDDRSSPFAFLTICDVLGLEPDYLRSQVARRLRSAARAGHRTTRRSVRGRSARGR